MVDTASYKTKSYFEKRKSPSRDGIWPIGLDVGYSGVKVFAPNYVASFPSVAVKMTGNGFIGNLPDDCIRIRDDTTGDIWLVGQAAQDTISDEDTSLSSQSMYTRNRYDSAMFLALVQAGLGFAFMRNEFGSPQGREVYVQTGLPQEYIEEEGGPGTADLDKEMLTRAIAGKHNFTMWIGQNQASRYNVYIKPENIYTIPQPRGTLFSVATGKDGNILPGAEGLFNKKGLVFDAGFGTLDIFSLKNNRIDSGQTWTDLGMKAVMEETARLIREECGIRISVPALQKYLDSGQIRYHKGRVSKNISFADQLERASKKVCEEAVSRLFQTFPLYEYDYIIITGGTGAAWKEYIQEDLREMETLDVISGDVNDVLPMIFSNCRGFYFYRLMRLSISGTKR